MQSPIPPIPTSADVAQRLERLCRILAPLLCLAIAAALTMAQCCYQCGYQLGRAVHDRNDQLSAIWRIVCGVPSPAVPASVPASVPAPPLVHPLAALGEALDSLTLSELRRITGTRRKCRKAELISLALAMA